MTTNVSILKAIASNIDVVRGCPNERAHDGFREKEARCLIQERQAPFFESG